MSDGTATFPLALWEREQLCEQSELTTAGEGLIRCTDAKRHRCKASIVKFFPLLGEGLRERVNLEDRPLKLTEGRNAGCQASFIYNYFSKIATKFIIDNSFASMPLCIWASRFSLPSCPPVFCSSDLTHPFTSPPLKGGEKESSPQPSPIGEGAAQYCYCEGTELFYKDKEGLYKIQVSGAAATLPSQSHDSEMLKHGGQSDVLDDTNPLPQSLPQGREVKIRSSRFTLHPSLKKRAAFTLAEVLITLGIIGVVAAMTIPTVIAKYQEAQLKAQFKKTYSTILQAMQYVAMENGGYIDCYYNGANTQKQCQPFYKQMAEHIKYVKYCPKNSYEQGCIPKYKSYHTGACYGYNEGAMNKRAFTYVLADGSLLISYDVGQEAIFAVDINGKKGPNDRGKDLFSFVIYKNDKGGYYIGDNITSCMNTSDNEYVYIDDMYK